jgi:hypothetical protein
LDILDFCSIFSRQSQVIRANGGVRNYLYELKQLSVENSNTLGKLDITWRTTLGEPGRLQTQQILGGVSFVVLERLVFLVSDFDSYFFHHEL